MRADAMAPRRRALPARDAGRGHRVDADLRVPAPMGPLSFARGADLRPLLDGLRVRPRRHGYDAAVSERFAAERVAVESGPYEVGEVSFHGALCFHTAGRNGTTQPRRALATTYYADGARVVDSPTLISGSWRDFLPDTAPGEVAATPLNPVVGRLPGDWPASDSLLTARPGGVQCPGVTGAQRSKGSLYVAAGLAPNGVGRRRGQSTFDAASFEPTLRQLTPLVTAAYDGIAHPDRLVPVGEQQRVGAGDEGPDARIGVVEALVHRAHPEGVSHRHPGEARGRAGACRRPARGSPRGHS